MQQVKVICDKCHKPIEGNYYSDVLIISKYKKADTEALDMFSDLLFGAAQTFGNDTKIEVCPECAKKIKEIIISSLE